jgi:phosphatidylglycerophosphatase A
MRQVIIFLASGAYTGYSPFAPGTAGSVVGLIIGYFFCAPMWQHEPMMFVLIFAAVMFLSCLIAGRAEEIFGEHDSSKIVLDEVLGMIATMFLNPLGWVSLLGGFILFRLFDIIKPFPADLIDRKMPGGPGVMLDDLFAGIYANIILRISLKILAHV